MSNSFIMVADVDGGWKILNNYCGCAGFSHLQKLVVHPETFTTANR